MTTIPRNIRFWDYGRDSAVKITLRPGQSLSHNYGGQTDEGYDYHRTVWTYCTDGALLVRSCGNRAKDCDGRIDRYSSQEAPTDRLAVREAMVWDFMGRESYDRATPLPEWQDGESSQRDYSAEAMGY